MHDDTVLRRLFDFGNDNSAFLAVGLVEVSELGEWVVADDIGVQDEERGGVFAQGFGGEFEGAGGAEGLILDGEFDTDIVFLFVLKMKICH